MNADRSVPTSYRRAMGRGKSRVRCATQRTAEATLAVGDSTGEWRLNGVLHRVDGPALEHNAANTAAIVVRPGLRRRPSALAS
jgi:hypothetical protein